MLDRQDRIEEWLIDAIDPGIQKTAGHPTASREDVDQPQHTEDDMGLDGQNETLTPHLRGVSADLQRAARLIDQLAKNAADGHAPPATALTPAIVLLKSVRAQLPPDESRRRPGSARTRIRDYLESRAGEIVSADELAEVAGIHAWARRIRELRDAGYDIEHLGGGRYRLRGLD